MTALRPAFPQPLLDSAPLLFAPLLLLLLLLLLLRLLLGQVHRLHVDLLGLEAFVRWSQRRRREGKKNKRENYRRSQNVQVL